MIKISLEEQMILDKLTIKDLIFFKKLSSDKDFASLKELVNTLMLQEKNFVLGFKGTDGEAALAEIKYAQGGMKMLRKLLEIILASDHEISKREDKRKEK